MNNTAVEGVKLLGERGIPAAAVATMLRAISGEGLSTWNDLVPLQSLNPLAQGSAPRRRAGHRRKRRLG